MLKVLAGDLAENGYATILKSFTGKIKGLKVPISTFRFRNYNRDQIASIELVTQSNSTSILAKAGWGAVGALALGPLGLLAGVLGGGNRSTTVIAIEFADGKRALITGKPREIEALLAAKFRE